MSRWMVRILVMFLAMSGAGNFWFYLEHRQNVSKIEKVKKTLLLNKNVDSVVRNI